MSYQRAWDSTPSTDAPTPASYEAFLDAKSHAVYRGGFTPTYRPAWMFDFQAALMEWAVERGRAAIFADCGLGKTPTQLAWAQNVVEHTNRHVLVLTPLAVGAQTLAEAEKFSIPAMRSREGALPAGATIIVTNYERLHLFSPSDFAGVVCDESSILKHYSGATQKQVTRFLLKVPYRLLCTATAAPNDYIELGTSSEALGELGYSDMLTRFFRQTDGKPHRMEEVKMSRKMRASSAAGGEGGNHYGKLAFRVSQAIGQWRLKGHAADPFWRWVAGWARACRKPSDLGFDDARFVLPPLTERDHVVVARRPPQGMLFTVPAFGLQEEREERRRTLAERVELASSLVAHDRPAVVWCHMNDEGDALERAIAGSVQVAGSDSDDAKELAYERFASGDARVIVIKPKIGAFGLNWQHCAHVVTFASHSYEQYYQSVRRCWRFGQASPVTVDIISTEGEVRVRENMRRKAHAADYMFAELVKHMNNAIQQERVRARKAIEVPSWLTR